MLNKKNNPSQWLQRSQRHKHWSRLCSLSQAVEQKMALYIWNTIPKILTWGSRNVQKRSHICVYSERWMLVFLFPVSHIFFPFFHNFMSLFTLLTATISWERNRVHTKCSELCPWLILLSYRTPSPSPSPHLIRAPHNFPSAAAPCWGPDNHRWNPGTLPHLCSLFILTWPCLLWTQQTQVTLLWWLLLFYWKSSRMK